ncbi:hypothetical protein QQF64_018654 [Cirrhinus molitorella]|uniref:Uncharacterized protein n=1 Tax=Cirrhinus molitorella TaxID=172907 RepID=A0ABR3LDD0_9TELE
MFQAGPVERDPEELHALITNTGQDTRQARDIPGTTRRRAGEIRRLARLRCEAKARLLEVSDLSQACAGHRDARPRWSLHCECCVYVCRCV